MNNFIDYARLAKDDMWLEEPDPIFLWLAELDIIEQQFQASPLHDLWCKKTEKQNKKKITYIVHYTKAYYTNDIRERYPLLSLCLNPAKITIWVTYDFLKQNNCPVKKENLGIQQ